MTTWATPDTFAIGDHPTAPQINKITGDLQIIGGAWTAYTPTWSGTGVSLGNGTITAAYQLIDKTMRLRIRFVAGTTTNFGSGTFSFSLPSGITAISTEQIGTCKAACAGVNYGACFAYVPASGTTIQPWGPTASGDVRALQMDATHPATFTATTSNSITLAGVFQVA